MRKLATLRPGRITVTIVFLIAVFGVSWLVVRRPEVTGGTPVTPRAAITPIKVLVPTPANGKSFTRAELEQHFPELMADFQRLEALIPMDSEGLPDYPALAAKGPAELIRLASQISQVGRAQFRALIQFRMENFTVLERAFGGLDIANKLLVALDAADAAG